MYRLAILGATGLVGQAMIKVLEERTPPISEFIPLASEKSKGSQVVFRNKSYKVDIPTESVWKDVDIALFSAGGAMSKEWAPIAAKAGVIVVDNSSAFRMEKNVPLIVPEVNSHAMVNEKMEVFKIIANPNCSTIQMVVPLKPLHEKYKIKRIIVSTYQSVTGRGKLGLDALENEVKGEKQNSFVHFKPIAYNVVPQVDMFLDNGYTKEEMKMIDETKKILEDDNLGITATTVRVPVYGGHSEAVNVEFESEYSIKEVFNLLRNAKGVKLEDDVKNQVYPTPIFCSGKDDVFVGRVRRDLSKKNSLNMWIVADNLRKGAATNSVQILEKIIEFLQSR